MSAATPPPLDAGSRMALDRTWLAYERTLMACVRSSEDLPLNARRMLDYLVAPPPDEVSKLQ